MATKVEIFNKALGHIGSEATVASPTEASVEAQQCNSFYDYARRTALETHAWKFARTRILGALTTYSYTSWEFIYQEPDNCISVRAVLPDGYTNDQEDAAEFDCEAGPDGERLILTNTENATIVYTVDVEDPQRFTPLFVEALSWLLASYIAGPILKGDEGAKMSQQCFGVAMGMMGRGASSSANQAKTKPLHTAPWIGAR